MSETATMASVAELATADLTTATKAVWSLVGSTRHLQPVLAGVIVSAYNGKVALTGCNFDSQISRRIPFTGDFGDDILVELAGLKTAVATLDQRSPVHLERQADALLVSQGKKRVSLKAMDLDYYPKIPAPDADVAFTVTGTQLEFIADKVQPFAGADDMLPVLTGLHFAVANDVLTVSGTDRFRMAQATFDVAGSQPCEAIIPNVSKIGTLFGDEQVAVTVTEAAGFRAAYFDSETTTVVQRVIDGDFPRLSKLWPDMVNGSALFDAPTLLKALKFVSTGIERNMPVILDVTDGSLAVASTDDPDVQMQMKDEVEAFTTGEPIHIGFNPKLLSDIMKVFGRADVSMTYTVTSKPVVFTALQVDNFRALLMPRRLEG